MTTKIISDRDIAALRRRIKKFGYNIHKLNISIGHQIKISKFWIEEEVTGDAVVLLECELLYENLQVYLYSFDEIKSILNWLELEFVDCVPCNTFCKYVELDDCRSCDKSKWIINKPSLEEFTQVVRACIFLAWLLGGEKYA
ncbi:MAG: hypothetical protein IJT32_00725 [Lachnospiraceae bacterium]|nr:hypothetical protein [Lachnospiraceae bacterium]